MSDVAFPKDEYRTYLRAKKRVPEQHVPVYETTVEKFINTFPEVPIDSFGRKHLDQYLEKVQQTGPTVKLLRNMNIVCETFLHFVRERVSAPAEAPKPVAKISLASPAASPVPAVLAAIAAKAATAAGGVSAARSTVSFTTAVGTAKVNGAPLAAKMGSANFGRRPMRPKEVGFLSVPPCPQCGAELVSNASNGSMDTAFKAAGIGGALIAYAFCAKYSCPEHGEIDSDHFPDAHRSALFRRRCAFIGSGIVVVLLCIKLVIWLQ